MAFQISASLATDFTDSTDSIDSNSNSDSDSVSEICQMVGKNLQLARRHLQTARHQAAIMQVRACHCARNCGLFQLENVSG